MLNVIRQRLSVTVQRKGGELVRDERGASFIEYVIVCGVIAIAAITAFRTFGTAVQTEIGNSTNAINGVGAPAAP